MFTALVYVCFLSLYDECQASNTQADAYTKRIGINFLAVLFNADREWDRWNSLLTPFKTLIHVHGHCVATASSITKWVCSMWQRCVCMSLFLWRDTSIRNSMINRKPKHNTEACVFKECRMTYALFPFILPVLFHLLFRLVRALGTASVQFSLCEAWSETNSEWVKRRRKKKHRENYYVAFYNEKFIWLN